MIQRIKSALAVAASSVLLACGIASAEQKQPNIILFVVDDMGVRDYAAGGSRFYVTPHIDQLSRDGMTFRNAYVSHPRCSPSRYSLMTGRLPARAGIPGGPEKLDAGRTTVATALHDGGYSTYFLGKWHIGGTPDHVGFEVNIAGGEAGAPGSYFWPYTSTKGKKGKGEDEGVITGLEVGKPGEHLTVRLTEEAEKLIRKHEQATPDKPFFLELAHYGVHTPLEDTPELIAKFDERLSQIGRPEGPGYEQKDGTTKLHQDNATYAAMLSRVDDSLGRIVGVLNDLRITDDTLIVFTSDHGGLSNRGADSKRELATSNLPYRAGKGHLFEGGIRVPLIVKWPGHVKAGSATDAFTVNTDHFATFLDLAKLPQRPKDAEDSVTYLPALRGEPLPARGPVVWYSPRPRPSSTGDQSCGAIRVGDLKLMHWYGNDSLSLYDLSEDPYEQNDLSATEPERATELNNQLVAWLKSIHAIKPRSTHNAK